MTYPLVNADGGLTEAGGEAVLSIHKGENLTASNFKCCEAELCNSGLGWSLARHKGGTVSDRSEL